MQKYRAAVGGSQHLTDAFLSYPESDTARLAETVSFPHTLHAVVIYSPFRFDQSGTILAPAMQIYPSRIA
jgi:hypothetical protein